MRNGKELCPGYGEMYTPKHPKCMECPVRENCRREFLDSDLPKNNATLVQFLSENLLETLEHLPQDNYNENLTGILKQLRTIISKNVDK